MSPTTQLVPASSITPGQRIYRPAGAARELMRNRDPEVLIEGPAGTGKSRACLEKLHLACLNHPGIRALMVRKTRESMTESVLVTFEEHVLPVNSPIAAKQQRRLRQAYRYPNGSIIVVGGLDKASRIMSTEYDLVYVAEATELSENDWESLSTRVRNGAMSYQQLLADCNPGPPAHWLNQRCNNGQTARLRSRHGDNPKVTPAYIARLAALTGHRRKRLYLGIWAAAEGLVYEDFDAAVHLVDRFPIPASWRRFRVVDFGFTNPFVCQWWAMDHDGRLFLYREIYWTKRIVSDHTAQILALSAGEMYEQTVADHDAEDRATMAASGINTAPAFKLISPGIQAVQDRLRPAGDGRPRLFLLRDSLVSRDPELAEAARPASTLEEFEAYAWPVGVDGKAIKEEPVKVDDHGMDGVRYAVAYADGLGGALPFGWMN